MLLARALALRAAVLVCLMLPACHAWGAYEPEFAVPDVDENALNLMYTSELMNVACQYFIPQIEDALLETVFPDIEGSASTSIGDIDYSINSIAVTDLMFNVSYLTLDVDTQSATLHLDDAALALTFGYAMQLLSWPYTTDEGSGVLSASNLTVAVTVSAGKNESTGGFSFESYQTSVAIGAFDLDLDGGIVAILVNTLEDLLGDTVTVLVAQALEDLILDLMGTIFSSVNSDILMTCTDEVCEDLRLSDDLLFQSSAVTMRLGGTCYDGELQDAYEAPDGYTDLPAAVNDQMINAIYGPPVLTTFFDVLHVSGLLPPVTADANASQLLQADALAAAFPEFAAAFPGADATARAALLDAPTAEILYSAVQVTFSLNLTLAPDDAPDDAAAVLAVQLVAAGTLDMKGRHGEPGPVEASDRLTFEFAQYSCAVNVQESAVGSVTVTEDLEAWAEGLLFDAAVWGAWADTFGAYGIVFPFADFLYVDRTFIYTPDYVAGCVDYAIV
eukprot:gnl/Chilomastix_cuspidata/1064.p1 GENE.gnl/Chilomastix_cuspidata/1064~~gnl/Chilomastix_cuspidata/1064.p1  ORF type:complete len:503 (+),score=222.37 gnl/Chilomastix_cuspidata/1064:33-1541(+)